MKKLLKTPIKYLFLGSFLTLFLAVNVVFAAEIINDDEVLIGNNRLFEENLYIGASRTIIEGDVTEDLFVIGGNVTVSGSVAGDIFILGGETEFKGEVLGDLRIIGGNIKISGEVSGDLLALGGQITLEKDAKINSEIFIAAGRAVIENKNENKNELKIVAGQTEFNADVSGKTTITTQKLTIGSSSKIYGDFYYYAPQKFSEESGAIINGNIRFNEINTIRDTGFIKTAIISLSSFWFLLKFITLLILSFILVYVFRVFTQRIVDITINSFFKSSFAGLLMFLLIPIIIILLLVSLFAMPIGFLIALAYIFIIIIAPATSAIFIGTYCKQFINRKDSEEKNKIVDFQSAIIGVIIFTIIQFLPYVGGLFGIVMVIASLGSIGRYIRLSIIK